MVRVLLCLASFAHYCVCEIQPYCGRIAVHSFLLLCNTHCTNMLQFNTCNIEGDIWALSRLGLLTVFL